MNVLVKTTAKFHDWNAEQALVRAARVNTARRDIIAYATAIVRTDLTNDEVAFLGREISRNRNTVANALGVTL